MRSFGSTIARHIPRLRSGAGFTHIPRNVSFIHTENAPKQVAVSEDIKAPELEYLRLMPAMRTFFNRTASHDEVMDELKDMLRKYQDLPVLKDTAEINAAYEKYSFPSLAAYKSTLKTGSVGHGRYAEFLRLVRRLSIIDPQLMPPDLTKLLDKYSGVSGFVLPKKESVFKPLDEFGRAITVGRRKTASAKIIMARGTGEFLVNDKPMHLYFSKMSDRFDITYPLKVVESEGKYNIYAAVIGGGSTGQKDAIALGIAKALVLFNPLLRTRLYKAGCLTRDVRKVERKKPGHIKSRKMPTWVKR